MIIGNSISLAAAVFTVMSSWSKDRRKIYLYQAIQCLLLAVANLFFASLSGTTTYFLCAVRNTLLAGSRFTGKACIVFVAGLTAIGLAANNRGVTGLLPVVTTAIYSIACLYVKETKAIKINIIVNLSLWASYDILIRDYVSFAVDTVSAATALISLFR